MINFKNASLAPALSAILCIGFAACGSAPTSQAQVPTQTQPLNGVQASSGAQAPFVQNNTVGEAIVAGGCFWCVESDFEKLDGVIEAISGYSGGTLDDPSYKAVTYGSSGHYEVAKIIYDPSKVSYEAILEHFWTHVDPTDAGGQFCDRGDSYRTAIFATPEQMAIAQKSKAALASSSRLSDPVVTPILPAVTFYPAEDYHQNYYKTNSLKYKFYRNGCGRDRTLARVWGR